ncbi:hypothetical protein DV737_g1901, partial [Chaetothyriales sp. CBS 132003]
MNLPSPAKIKSQSLAVRKSISRTSEPEQKRKPAPPPEYDMAELINEQTRSKYVKGDKLGSGTYADVFKGTLRSDPSKVFAIKKFKIDPNQLRDGINVDTIREIKYLQEISHPTIVALYDIFSSKDEQINMVIEFCPNGSLEDLLRDKAVQYGAAEIKAWMSMLCRAVYYCHSHFILHRDIKPGNLLIAANGEVKLADFGLARYFAEPGSPMTTNVVTLWYRSPELLFGSQHYGGCVDIWSCGVVMADLIMRRPFLPSIFDDKEIATGGEIAQIETICMALGTPNEDVWPGVSKLRGWFAPSKQIPPRDRTWFRQQFATVGPSGADLIANMLKFDPRKRATARTTLEHEYWAAEPRPVPADKLPKKGGGTKKAAAEQTKVPGELDERFKGVAKKLDFSAFK